MLRCCAKHEHLRGWGMDGAELHRRVQPEMWCVTRSDFIRLRKNIQEAVREGKIQPIPVDGDTGRGDPFDPSDDTIGPSVYNVVDNYIKPLTRDAGKMSWALMCHPDGLECDIFITHAWAEGVYEFIDKVLESWPAFKKAAWCCFLANPQNLDISELLHNPRTSPFALALRRASCMMVVPTKRCSIYGRVWCIYEAYLAMIWDKMIFTALAPIRRRLYQICVLFLVIAGVSFTLGIVIRSACASPGNAGWCVVLTGMTTCNAHTSCAAEEFCSRRDLLCYSCFSCHYCEEGVDHCGPLDLEEPRPSCEVQYDFTCEETVEAIDLPIYFNMTIFLLAVLSGLFQACCRFCVMLLINSIGIAAFSFLLGWLVAAGEYPAEFVDVYSHEWPLVGFGLLEALVVFFLLSQIDCLLRLEFRQESNYLEEGYNGVAEAESSDDGDKARILEDIGIQTDNVNGSVRVLVEAGMSTKGLRAAAHKGAAMRGVAVLHYSWCILGLIVTCYTNYTLDRAPWLEDCKTVAHARGCLAIWIMIALCVISWFFYERDSKAFMMTAAMKLTLGSITPICVWVNAVDLDLCGTKDVLIYWLIWSVSLTLICGALGRRHIVRLPWVGVPLLELLGPRCNCCHQRCRRRPTRGAGE